ILGSTGTGPVVDQDGKPRRGLNQFDTRPGADDPSAPAPDPSSAQDGADARRAPVLSRRWVRIVAATAVPLLVLAVWHLVTDVTGMFESYQLPSPTAVWQAAVELAVRENGANLWTHIQISVQRVLMGFTFGAVVGLAVGSLVGLSRWADVMFAGTI